MNVQRLTLLKYQQIYTCCLSRNLNICNWKFITCTQTLAMIGCCVFFTFTDPFDVS